MNLTATQVVQLLWIHYHEEPVILELTDSEVIHLELELVSKFGELNWSNPYVKQLFTQDKEELIDFLLNNSCKSIFNKGK